MLDRSVFAARRRAYLDALGPDAVAVVSSLPERLRNCDSHYAFRQHSDVHYLTGFAEPEATVVLRPGATGEEVVMFVRPRDPEMETWNGRRAGLDGVKALHGADVAYPHTELAERLPELIANREHLHYALGLDPDLDLLVRAPSRACASSRSAASARRVTSSIRAWCCTSCACTSRPTRSRCCAAPPRSPATRTSRR